MALNVKFLKGTAENFQQLQPKNADTFYLVSSTTAEGVVVQDLYLGDVKLSNQPEITAALAKVTTAEGRITNLETALGTIANLTTEAKDNLVAAINELATKVANVNTDSKVTLVESNSDDYAKVYKIYQGETKTDDAEFGLIGTINIPKDMVVQSGSLVKDPEGQEAGTYIELVLANATNDKIYINVANLIDIYTAKANAAEVQVAVSETGEISATLVDGGIATAKLADGAVTTVKIADNAVTNDKLDSTLQGAISKANSAVQSIVSGTSNGTISVDGTEVAVKGLGTAAYADLSQLNTSVEDAEKNAKKYVDEALTWGSF